VNPKRPVAKRRQIFDKHLLGLELGESELDDVKEKLGEPGRTLREDRVTVLEYDAPEERSLTRWKKVQFIFFDELLLNVTYAEPEARFSRAELHELLGEPDEIPEDEDDEDTDGVSDIFEVELDEEPLLSFVAHYTKDEEVEAFSLCADMSEDMLDDEEKDEEPGER
jgi:hypothetical protein